ncbi:MAG: NAD-dependent epimerase/dehydratase family protein, partial [Chloroflexota bacterium]
LRRAGYPLRILTRSPHKHGWLAQYPQVEVVQGDIRTGEGLDAIADCTHVVHAAGLFSMWQLAGDFEATNVTGTKNMLQAAVNNNIQRFIHVSTIAVIGTPQVGRIIDEQHPPRPSDKYQLTKLQAEYLVSQYERTTDLQTVILRPGAFYGPLGDYAFNRLFFRDPMRGLIVEPDGGHYLTFPAYIGDVAGSVVSALKQGRSGETYNICDTSITHKEVYDIVCELADLSFPRVYLPNILGITGAALLTMLSRLTRTEPFYPLGLRSYVFNNWWVTSEKAQSELGFVPTDFRTGAERTIAWYRAGQPTTLPELQC